MFLSDHSGPRLIERIDTLLREATDALQAAGIEDAPREARLLLAYALDETQENLLRDRDRQVPAARFMTCVRRRAAHEPFAFIVGRRDFWTLSLAVSPATLIPRPDSETLIEAALAAMPDRNAVRSVLDLGTGTGCLLLAALSEFPRAWGLGIDVSPAAARLAAANAVTSGLAARASLLCGHWGQACRGWFDVILCNPPYIATPDLAGLMPEVAAHEPSSALDGGADGYDAYRQLLPDIARLLAPPHLLALQSVAVLEIGQGQAAGVTALAEQAGLVADGVRYDLASIPRALVLRRMTVAKKPFGGTPSRG